MNKLYFFDRKVFTSEEGLKYILSCCINIYLFIQLFDISRNALLLPGIVNALFALLREISLIGPFIYLLTRKEFKITSMLFLIIAVSFFLPLIISIGAIIDNTILVPIKDVIQYTLLPLRPLIFLYVICNLDSFYVFRKQNLIKTFISILVFIVLFSFLVYFFLPSLISKYNIENRVGLGNMSVQSGMYLCAYILCFYYFPFKNKKRNWFCIFVLLLGILLSVCSTGIISTIFVTILFLFEKNTRKRSFTIFLFAIILLIIVIFRYYSLLKPFMDYFKGKADDVIDLFINFFNGDYGNKTIKSNSFNAREIQIQNMLLYNNKPIDYLFGHGYFSVIIPHEMVENGYYEVYFSCGFFGVITLALLTLKYGFISLKLFFRNNSVIGICALGTVLLFMVTLCVIVLAPLFLSFIVMFYIIFFMEKESLIEYKKQ